MLTLSPRWADYRTRTDASSTFFDTEVADVGVKARLNKMESVRPAHVEEVAEGEGVLSFQG